MPAHGKRYQKIVDGLTREPVSLEEAVKMIKSIATAKFDETVELIANLGIDPKKADQQVRGTVSLPNGTGKSVRVAVFAEGEQATAAKEAGAEVVGSDDLVQKITEGFLDFDVVIAAPDMMRHVGKLGKILGPRGLMPNPKTGTVTNEIAKTVKEFKAGKIEFRADKAGGIHVPVGKASFTDYQLLGNIQTVIAALLRAKPATAKGTYMKSVYLSTTMGPSIRLDPNSLRDVARAA
ncbi:MAG TPA: 50S ribosomal protein L1 [bacterium]|nr:50S ribosomal protein L1 [Candidatus Omnitrophota bacterium]HOJ62461.1 50S ribosomal protein L1 [bacterium]HOL92747.1 50S ribosomal protein L1 [bacterium]HPO99038.1 50S ribosomal protein L1 [bacterium]HXK93710.1 50S ribosomal protein L1 [bacterium]